MTALFLLVACLPLSAMQSKEEEAVKFRRPQRSWLQRLRSRSRPPRRTYLYETWQRKETTFVSQPMGADYVTFVREKRIDDRPASDRPLSTS